MSEEPLFDEGPITFHSEGVGFSIDRPQAHADWIAAVAEAHDCQVGELAYVFCSDEYLHRINVEHLGHDTYTDIITFDYTEDAEPLSGDLFISVERIRENATAFNEPFERELRRVMIHGVLHLIGFGDKTEEERAEMKSQEERALAMFHVEQ